MLETNDEFRKRAVLCCTSAEAIPETKNKPERFVDVGTVVDAVQHASCGAGWKEIRCLSLA